MVVKELLPQKELLKTKITKGENLMKNNYVVNHDFGYGKEVETKELNKIMLRNFKDLKVYLNNVIKSQFDIINNTIDVNGAKIKLILTKIKSQN